MLSFSLTGLTFAAVAAAQTLSPSVQHAKRSQLPSSWSRVRRHAPDAVLPLRFGLTQPNVDFNTLQELLNDVSHPESPNYGNHWTATRVAEHFAPSDEAVHAVTSWISENGVARDRVHVSKTKGWVMLNATVAEAEALLNTEYHVFEHDSGKEHVACDAYNLPAHIVPHVEIVTPSIDFNAVLSKRSSTSTHIKLGQPGSGTVFPKFTETVSTILHELENCNTQITPACLRALYGFLYEPLVPSKNSYGIVEYTPQAYRPADLDMFAQNFSSIGKTLIGARPVLQSIDGGVVQNISESFNFNGESNLDLEYAMNLVTAQQPVTLYQVGDLIMGASFNNLLDALDGSFCSFEGGDDPNNDGIYPDNVTGGYQKDDCGTVKPANVISTSYGYNEADLSPAYTARQCAEYAKLGLLGVTVIYSSGDFGVAGNGGACLNADGTQTVDGTIFNPAFPSTCPFITSVGATQVNPGAKVTDPESACNQVIFSGGGFSNYFPIPDYQQAVVASYLKNTPPPYASTVYNSTGTSRTYPDLAANGANYVIAIDGQFGLVFGTSASAPVVGSMLTMINDARLAIGKKPIGFINPTIYSPAFRGAFNDITNGTNPGCGTVGFSTAKGYDPVTGLGTPNFPKLLAEWLLLK
ncbi:subtilisin-like protein [Mycena metata]|uniref:tripeptidyl-peptidase II n=1 Tax=Mycena metata TaxID=1033252 RepID=A0AAD7HLE6_9AGAR|nr:subtilisin-like protein [Mycena metata]